MQSAQAGLVTAMQSLAIANSFGQSDVSIKVGAYVVVDSSPRQGRSVERRMTTIDIHA
jgi:hypothetical protein